MKDKIRIKYEPNYFAGIEIKPDESFIDAVCRLTPARQRALSGLSLKMVSMKIKEMNDEHIDKNVEANVLNEIDRLNGMTDEEYDLEKLRGNGVNIGVEHNTNENSNEIIESFKEACISLKDENVDFLSVYDVLKRISEEWPGE